jgi:hypothetical protein
MGVLWAFAIQHGTALVYFVVVISTLIRAWAFFCLSRVLKPSILDIPAGYKSFTRFFTWWYTLIPVSLLFDIVAFGLIAWTAR